VRDADVLVDFSSRVPFFDGRIGVFRWSLASCLSFYDLVCNPFPLDNYFKEKSVRRLVPL